MSLGAVSPPSGVPPTAHASSGELAHTPQRVAVVPESCSENEEPSQCTMRPPVPTIHTSLEPEPPTPQNVSGPPGDRSVHLLPSKWSASVSKPSLPSGPPTTKTSSGPVP